MWMGGAEALETLEFVTSSQTTTTTLTAPADIQAGDFLVILQRASSYPGGTPSTVTPSGFSEAVNTNGTGAGVNTRQILNYKIADGTEASANFTIMNGSDSGYDPDERGLFLVFRANVPLASASLQDPDGQFTTGNPTAQTITSGSGTPPLIAIGTYGAFNSITTPTMSPTEDGTVSSTTTGTNDISLKYKIYNVGDSPANVSVDMGDAGGESNNILQSCYFNLAA